MEIVNYDQLLGIETEGNQKGFLKSIHYHRYEPTPYEAILLLLENYHIDSGDRIVDFGCGKGRLNFILHYLCRATVIGVEMNEEFYDEAVKNERNYRKVTKRQDDNMKFYCTVAEQYEIHSLDNKFYFFNPFTVQIFIKVVNRILRSVEQSNREVDIILYYPSPDYIFYLENETNFELYKEITLPNSYPKNQNERLVIYRLKQF